MGESGPVVVKVGGSLFDLPDLGPRLRAWLGQFTTTPVLIIPGGGATADAVRHWDAVHNLGEEASHWLALRALTLNAHWLAGMLGVGVGGEELLRGCLFSDRVAVLDAFTFATADDANPGALPHAWDATSDALAARVAVVTGATRLYLLKSVTLPVELTWQEAAAAGFVDPVFPGVVERVSDRLAVQAVNFRDWRPPCREPGPPAAAPWPR